MFKKNTAVVGFPIGNFINASTGATVTTGTPVETRLIDGTGAALTNAATYNTDAAQWEIDLDAADMNGDVIGLSFALTSCLPISYAIKTVLGVPQATIAAVSDLGTVQTGDSFAIVSGDHGLVSIQDDVDAILADTNELQTDWVNGGRLDLILDAAGGSGDPWATALPGAYGAGTAGKLIGDNINAPIATVDTVVDAIKAVTDNLPNSGALTDIAQASVCTETRLAELDAANLPANVDAILTDTSTTLEGHLTDIKGATFAGATDSLEAIRNRGDAAWITADVSGVSTHSAADVKTAIEAGGSSIAQILEDTGTTLDTLIKDVPTVAEFNARTLPSADYVVTSDTIAGVTTATNLTNAPTAGDLTAAMKASINTEVDTALDTAISSPTAGSIADYVTRMKYVICNKFTIDSDGGESVVHNDSNTAVSTVPGAFTEASTIKTRLKVY